MIKTIRAENIYNYVNAITGMSALATVFSMKPEENSTPTGSYVYMTVVSQIPRTKTQKGYITKTARISFHIIAKKTL
jgi:hypothetical protein